MAYGQVIDVSDLYATNDYFFPQFEYLGENANLPHFRISSLVEDHEGYLWIGTKDGGLIKYDGHNFSSFELDPNNPFSLSSNDVFFVFEDSRNMLWVGTDNGLDYYHPIRRQFIKLKLVTTGDSLVVPRNISCIAETNNGNLLIGTNIGIFEVTNVHDSNFLKQNTPVINHSSAQVNINQILLQPEDPLVASIIIKDIIYDTNGHLWILSEKELGYINYLDYSIIQNEKKHGYKADGSYQSVTDTDEGSKLFIDNNGVICVNTVTGLVCVSTDDTLIQIDSILYKDNTESIDSFIKTSRPGSKYWVGHFSNNLQLFDVESKMFFPLTFETHHRDNIHDNGISIFHRTSSNVIFLGTSWGGLYKFNPNSILSSFHPKLQTIHQNQKDNLRHVYEDSKGYIWMIARDLYRCDRYTGEVISTYNEKFFNHDWSYVNNIIEDKNGRFWIGMESRGLFYLDIENTSKTNNYDNWKSNYHNVINNKTITALYESDDGMIWAGTIYRDIDSAKIYTELFKMDLEGKIAARYPIKKCLLRNGNETDQFINQIYIDDDNIWLATGFGLAKLNEHTNEIQLYSNNYNDEFILGNNKILAVCPDPYHPDSILWLGSANRGLLCYDINNNLFYSAKKSVEIETNHIASILNDNLGNLWLGTDKGISKVVLDKNGGIISHIINFNTSDGLITSDFTNYYGPNAVSTTHNRLIFTGPRGFNIIEPENIKDDSNIPILHITDFTINHKPANFGQAGSPLKKSISLTKEIDLSYDKNTLGFEITALDFKSPEQLSYAFKLSNYDNEWVYNNEKRTIQYTKLPSGKYNLIIKVATRDGVWSDDIVGLKIQIGSPWWANVYAYIIYTLIFIGGVLFVDKFQRKRHNINTRIRINQLETDKLKELDLMKSRFFANISHEFKTPLTLILNPVDDMLTKQDFGESRNSLLMIKRNAKRLQKYITEILELSKLDANRLKLFVRELDIVEFLKYQIASFESLAFQKNISINLISPENEIICYLDPEKLNTIISNLLSNAIKFTPNGGKVEIELSGCLCYQHEHCTQKKGCLVITIKDNGKGIAQSKVQFIFDRYFKGIHETEYNKSGTGLGLALVRELVSLHHGTINVDSVENKFTKFQIHFPMDRNHIDPDELVKTERYKIGEDFGDEPILLHEVLDEENTEFSELNSKIILIIEDNKDMRTLISGGLKRKFKIFLAKDGEEGIKMAIETSPDLIICDVMMPKKDGFEVVKTLKLNELTSHIPIILLTAKSLLSDKLTGLSTGADDYLIKPFYPKELKVRVNNLLDQRDKLRDKFSRLNILKLDNLPNKPIDQIFLEKIVKHIELHLSDENFGVQTILEDLSISRTQLHRKLKAILNQSANELIQSIRLQKASEMLKNKVGTVSEICYLVGFTSPPYFTRLFKQHFGHNPTEHTGS
ncbi:MAG: two-component regulator propeller domain-containing protein [Pseudomonadota bacterium]